MLRTYQYMILKIFRFYKFFSDKKPEWNALVVITILELFNIYTIYLYLSNNGIVPTIYLNRIKSFVIGSLLSLPIISINYFVFIKDNKFSEIDKQFSCLSKTRQKLITILINFYIVLSIVIIFLR